GGGAGSRGGQMVFVKTANGFEPRLVRLGVSNFDYAQVLDGGKEGEEVALVSVAEIQSQRSQDMQRIRQRVGGGVPGAPACGSGVVVAVVVGRAGEAAEAIMPFAETMRVAFDALRANKLRSFLTMLGIVIGVSAVIAMVALGRGAQQSVKDRIASLGTTLLTV